MVKRNRLKEALEIFFVFLNIGMFGLIIEFIRSGNTRVLLTIFSILVIDLILLKVYLSNKKKNNI